MISRSIYNQLEKYTRMNRFTTTDAKDMESLIRSTFNPSFVVCTKCPQQIKHAQKIITNFLRNTQVYDEPILEEPEPLFQFEPVEVEVDIVEADKAGCTKCSRKKKIKR